MPWRYNFKTSSSMAEVAIFACSAKQPYHRFGKTPSIAFTCSMKVWAPLYLFKSMTLLGVILEIFSNFPKFLEQLVLTRFAITLENV